MRLLLLAILLIPSAAAGQSAGIAGNWITQDKSAVVAIARCGASLCGTVAKVLLDKPGMPKTDVRNPDPALRNRPIQGLRILGGFTGGGSRWENGRIYDPKSGKSYKSKLKLNDGSLDVSGCIAFLCKTQRWTRAR